MTEEEETSLKWSSAEISLQANYTQRELKFLQIHQEHAEAPNHERTYKPKKTEIEINAMLVCITAMENSLLTWIIIVIGEITNGWVKFVHKRQ